MRYLCVSGAHMCALELSSVAVDTCVCVCREWRVWLGEMLCGGAEERLVEGESVYLWGRCHYKKNNRPIPIRTHK